MATGNKFIAGLIAGTVAGAVVGLLLSPNSGKVNRQVVTARASELRHRAGETVGELRQRAGETVGELRQRMARKGQEAEAATHGAAERPGGFVNRNVGSE